MANKLKYIAFKLSIQTCCDIYIFSSINY